MTKYISQRNMVLFATLVVAAIISNVAVHAHADEVLKPHDMWAAWSFDPGIVICLLVSAGLYTKGWFSLFKKTSSNMGRSRFEGLCFLSGWIALVVALVSPIHPMGEVLFSAHMTQHEVLWRASPCRVWPTRPNSTKPVASANNLDAPSYPCHQRFRLFE